MRRLIQQILMGTVLVAVVAVAVKDGLTEPRVFILQSYDPGYAFSRDEAAGIRNVLDSRYHQYAVEWHWMDTKRHPWEHFKISAGIQARSRIDAFRPDVLIAIDDDAQKLVAKYYANRPGLSVVFGGVNAAPEAYGYAGAENVTGILERTPWSSVQDLILTLWGPGHAGPPKVVHLGDTTPTVRNDDEDMKQFRWDGVHLLPSQRISDLSEWKEAVAWANANADFIVISNCSTVKTKAAKEALVPLGEIVEWTEINSIHPVIYTNGFLVEAGGMLAVGASPFEQGEVAARMALELLDKKKQAKQIPIQSTRQMIVVIREERIKARGLHLPPIYEGFARATRAYFP